jgi:Na+-driven multidrug efflux pump
MQFRLLLWTASLIFCISFLKFGRSSFLFNKKHIKNNARVRSTSFDSSFDTRNVTSVLALKKKLDFEFLNVALPAFVALAADPLASFVDAVYVGRLGVKDQAGMGIAISTQYSLAKLYNDPLLKTSTSLVAGKSGDDLSASVATSLMIATSIGLLQMIVFLVFTSQLLTFMSVAPNSDMRQPAIAYLKWRALGELKCIPYILALKHVLDLFYVAFQEFPQPQCYS